MIERLIVDADVCIKLGSSEKYCILQQLLQCLSKKSFIHRYVYDEELLITASIKKQLNKLICDGYLEIIDESSLSFNDNALFNAVYSKLANVMIDQSNPRKNHGEVCSLAIAKTMSIPVFFTDERNLQPIIDRVLNTGLGDIVCIRIIDVVEKIKREEIKGFGRKQAKVIWRLSGKAAGVFDTEIWPIT